LATNQKRELTFKEQKKLLKSKIRSQAKEIRMLKNENEELRNMIANDPEIMKKLQERKEKLNSKKKSGIIDKRAELISGLKKQFGKD
jgi:hypothetical protein